MPRKTSERETSDPKPYRGLAWYDTKLEEISVFAGRSADVDECAERLFRSRVLVLHGRTGCGKSSFLRAGLQPALSKTSLRTQTIRSTGAHVALQIWRTGEKPLSKVAEAFHQFVSDVAAEENPANANSMRPRASGLSALSGLSAKEFAERCAEDSEFLLAALRVFQIERSDLNPVLVLDQAEEMWTLARRAPDGEAVEPSRKLADDHAAWKERRQFFAFLKNLCDTPLNTRIILSMRTEYKGQFDDELQEAGTPGPAQGVSGFYLDELKHDDLVEAILRPTEQTPRPPTHAAPYDLYHFSFANDVASLIAEQLLKANNGAPAGGVLPVLQVTCLRLYDMTRKANDNGSKPWIITARDFRLLGEVERQIDYFVQDRLEEAIKLAKLKSTNVSDEAERWYGFLSRNLVNVESDGRVTTKKVREADFVKRGRNEGVRAFSQGDASGGMTAPATKILEHLVKHSILRIEDAEGAREWSLAHDSVGLTLSRWVQTYGDQVHASKMEMTGASLPEQYKYDDLFSAYEDERDKPERISFLTQRDSIWDRMLILYAAESGFAERLNIDISVDPKLDISQNNLPSIRRALWEIATDDYAPNYLVAWPRADFPDDAKSTDWVDIVITNLCQGYGLIPPASISKKLTPYATIRNAKRDVNKIDAKLTKQQQREIVDEFCETMIAVVEHLTEKNASIWVIDEPAKNFIRLVFELADKHAGIFGSDAERAQFLDERIGDADEFESEFKVDSGARDALFSRLMSNADDSVGDDFVVGSAFTRALALSTQHMSLIDVQDLPEFIGMLVEQDKNPTEWEDYIDLYQSTQSHTTWQINFRHEDLHDERLDPVIYRIAALGLYTAEYVRTNADAYLRYIYTQIEGSPDLGAFRVDRKAIREAFRACYVWLPFEQYAPEFLDWRSVRSYQLRMSEGASPALEPASGQPLRDVNELSCVRSVYSRMLQFRQEFLSEFQLFNEQFIRILDDHRRNRDDSTLGEFKIQEQEAKLRPALTTADKYRACAWNNFRVFNYYDAAMMMRRARDELRRVQTGFTHPRQKQSSGRPQE